MPARIQASNLRWWWTPIGHRKNWKSKCQQHQVNPSLSSLKTVIIIHSSKRTLQWFRVITIKASSVLRWHWPDITASAVYWRPCLRPQWTPRIWWTLNMPHWVHCLRVLDARTMMDIFTSKRTFFWHFWALPLLYPSTTRSLEVNPKKCKKRWAAEEKMNVEASSSLKNSNEFPSPVLLKKVGNGYDLLFLKKMCPPLEKWCEILYLWK